MFLAPKGRDRPKVHPPIERGEVNNDGMDREKGVSKPNAMGSRMLMVRDVHIFRCTDVGGSNHGYMS